MVYVDADFIFTSPPEQDACDERESPRTDSRSQAASITAQRRVNFIPCVYLANAPLEVLWRMAGPKMFVWPFGTESDPCAQNGGTRMVGVRAAREGKSPGNCLLLSAENYCWRSNSLDRMELFAVERQ